MPRRPLGLRYHPRGRAELNMDVIKLLRTAVKLGASDLHLTTGAPPAVRIHGALKLLKAPPLSPEDCEDLVGQLVTSDQMLDFSRDHQLNFCKMIDGLGRFRVALYSQMGTLEASIRTSSTVNHSLDELGVPEGLWRLATEHRGLILVTGPAGHGKTTTFHALIDLINETVRRKVVTLEDPIEHIHPHKQGLVVQLEVGSDAPDYATGIQQALRQDADVIAVAELTDRQSIASALSAAESGHLVLGTLQTRNAQDTLSRLVGVFPPGQQDMIRGQLANSLLAVCSQRLLPRADGLGRVLACELLISNESVKQQILEDKVDQLAQTMGLSKSKGMRSLDSTIKRYLRERIITIETARAAVSDPRSIAESGT